MLNHVGAGGPGEPGCGQSIPSRTTPVTASGASYTHVDDIVMDGHGDFVVEIGRMSILSR